MAELLHYPFLILILIIQMVIGRDLQFIGGSANLVMIWLVCWGLHKQGKNAWYGALFAGLILSFASEVPWYANFAVMLFAVGFSRFFSKRFWHNPLVALFIVTFISSLIGNLIVFLVLLFSGDNLTWATSLTYVIIPSVFLDLLLTLPVYAIVHDMSRWMYPSEVEE